MGVAMLWLESCSTVELHTCVAATKGHIRLLCISRVFGRLHEMSLQVEVQYSMGLSAWKRGMIVWEGWGGCIAITFCVYRFRCRHLTEGRVIQAGTRGPLLRGFGCGRWW